jgi:hypothetical protein
MQSHICTASGSLSFRCDSDCLEAVRSHSLSCLVHRRSLPTLVSLACYMPTSFRFVHSQTTLYFESSTLIPFVTSQTTLSIVTWPYKPTRVFSACFVLTHMLTGKLLVGHPSKDYSKSSTLNCGVLMEWATKKKMHLVDIGSTKQFL